MLFRQVSLTKIGSTYFYRFYNMVKYIGAKSLFRFPSASCRDTYGTDEQRAAEIGAETRALCTSEYSDISPLTGGNVLFSTLEGRPSAYTFDNSPELQVCMKPLNTHKVSQTEVYCLPQICMIPTALRK